MIDLSKFTLPDLPYNILISLIIASVVALFFSFFRGSSLPRLIFAVLVSIGGFAVGQLVGNHFGWQFILMAASMSSKGSSAVCWRCLSSIRDSWSSPSNHAIMPPRPA